MITTSGDSEYQANRWLSWAREIEEESGLLARPTQIIGVYDANRSNTPLEFFHAYKIVFLCEIIGGKLCASQETMDAQFYPFSDLPPLSIERTNTRHLADIQDYLSQQHPRTFFD